MPGALETQGISRWPKIAQGRRYLSIYSKLSFQWLAPLKVKIPFVKSSGWDGEHKDKPFDIPEPSNPPIQQPPQRFVHPQVRPPQEPCTSSGFSSPTGIDATLRHPGQSMLNPTLVYTTVRHAPLATPNWQWELQNRKWRANAEHIVKLECLG